MRSAYVPHGCAVSTLANERMRYWAHRALSDGDHNLRAYAGKITRCYQDIGRRAINNAWDKVRLPHG